MTHRRAHAVAAGFVILAVLTACGRIATESPKPQRVVKPKSAVPTETNSGVPSQPPPIEPTEPTVSPPPKKSEPRPSSPAVAALTEEAEAAGKAGEWDLAAATLERAIRIQPRDPMLWHRLAEARLQQGQFQVAEDLAKKSNVFAGGDPEMARRNWRLIAQARGRKGDSEGVKDAEAKAGR